MCVYPRQGSTGTFPPDYSERKIIFDNPRTGSQRTDISVGNVSANLWPLFSINADVKIVENRNVVSKNGQLKIKIILGINHNFES